MNSVPYRYLVLFGFLISLNFKAQQALEMVELDKSDTLGKFFSRAISKDQLKNILQVLAADSLQGRFSCAAGQKKAANYITSIYKTPYYNEVLQTTNFFQKFPINNNYSENIIAVIPGSSSINHYVIVSAHYDHIGYAEGEVYNGADDNGSGSAAIIEVMRAFIWAYSKGYKPKKSIIFIHFSGEEEGLLGSKYFVNSNFLKLENMIANINLDMIGRTDVKHSPFEPYLYSVGSDYFSPDLDSIMYHVKNVHFPNLEINKRYNATNSPEMYYKRTDSYNFGKEGIPFIFFTNGEHEDYHKVTDTEEKIYYDLLQYRTQYIFTLIWELANMNGKLKIDPKKLSKFLRNNNSSY